MSASNYLENALLDHALGTTTYTKPTSVYVALFTSNPTDSDVGTEVSTGAGYARKVAAFDAASGGSASNTSDIIFAVATASWGTVSHVGIYDDSTGGNLLFHTSLSAAKAIATDDTILISAGNLTVNLD